MGTAAFAEAKHGAEKSASEIADIHPTLICSDPDPRWRPSRVPTNREGEADTLG